MGYFSVDLEQEQEGSMRHVSNNVITYPFVQFVSPDGTPRIQDAMVPTSNASAPKTDEEGHTTIDIEGVKQREKLCSPVPLMKQAEVRFTCSAKPVSMSQDLIDAAGNGLGGPVGILNWRAGGNAPPQRHPYVKEALDPSERLGFVRRGLGRNHQLYEELAFGPELE